MLDLLYEPDAAKFSWMSHLIFFLFHLYFFDKKKLRKIMSLELLTVLYLFLPPPPFFLTASDPKMNLTTANEYTLF